MSDGAPPIPDDVDILWKHSGASSYGSEPVSPWYGKIGRFAHKLFMLGATIFWGFQLISIARDFLSNPDRVIADVSSFFLPLTGLVVVLYIFKKFGFRIPISPARASGIPLWLSHKHLGFEPAKQLKTNLIPIDEIQTLSADYSEGAPAISVGLPTKTLTLISSETRSLLQTLYTLRPDLEPTS